MSRQNKVNPGMYTQRGRLTQDDAARELRKQSAIGSPHTWQTVNTKTRPRLAPAGDAARDTERSADNETIFETSPQVETRPASRGTRNMTATKAASNAKAKAAKAKTARTRKSKRTTGNAKTGKAMTTAMKRTTTKPTRKAVLARNVGGGGAAPRPTTKRRKS
jgi:hypothetical protein